MKLVFYSTALIWLLHLPLVNGYSQNETYLDYAPTTFEGSTIIEHVYSPSLEGNLLGDPLTQPVDVILPPGYSIYPKNSYPVVYFLHGGFQAYNTYTPDLLEKLNDLISNNIIAPMILVTPNGINAYGGSFFTNSFVTGNWEDYIAKDVVQHIENIYHVMDQRDTRGLSGYSMGAYGTISMGMKYPSKFGSISLIGSGKLDLEIFINKVKDDYIDAAKIGEYRANDPVDIRACFAEAAAYSPDSTAKSFCGLPYNAEGMRIDSVWQQWLMHDPLTLLPTYKDSLLKLNGFRIYVGDNDEWAREPGESYHEALLDQGIGHDYEIYSGGHSPRPVFNDMLLFFSDHLGRIVPTVRRYSNYYLENKETLIAEADMDGELYIVPFSSDNGLDSIIKYQIATADALANEENEFQLSEFGYGKYQVYAISSDTLVSNIPAEFCVVPDPSPPVLNIDNANVVLGDSIGVSMSRDGKICLVEPDYWLSDTLRTASDILNTYKLIGSVDALAVSEVSFSSDDLSTKIYWIYGFDQYGIVTGPKAVEVVPVGISINKSPEITLFPNPVSEIANIHLNTYARCEIEISSLNGQLIHSEEMEGTTYQIDLSTFQKGVYFITIRSNDFVTTRKIIKL